MGLQINDLFKKQQINAISVYETYYSNIEHGLIWFWVVIHGCKHGRKYSIYSTNSHGTPEMAQQGLPCPHQRRDLRALRRLKVVRYRLLPDHVTTGCSEFLNKNVHQMVKRKHISDSNDLTLSISTCCYFLFDYFNHLKQIHRLHPITNTLFLPIPLFLLLKSSYIHIIHSPPPPCHQHLPTEGVRQSLRSFLKLRSPRMSYHQPAGDSELGSPHEFSDQSLGKDVFQTFQKRSIPNQRYR